LITNAIQEDGDDGDSTHKTGLRFYNYTKKQNEEFSTSRFTMKNLKLDRGGLSESARMFTVPP
jgi:hypothetical protein